MQTVQLPEIEIGRAFVGAISWDASTAFGAEDLPEGVRVVGQFRHEPGCPVITTVDTEDGSLVVTDLRTLELRIEPDETAKFQGHKHAWIDFIRYDTGAGIPFAIKWPVVQPITVL